MAEGNSMITINPATLDDEKLWTYADLQQLCKKLNLGAKGRRLELVDKLQSWHKLRIKAGVAALSLQETSPQNEKDWVSLNVEGSNFSILSLNVKARCKSPTVNVVPDNNDDAINAKEDCPETNVIIHENQTKTRLRNKSVGSNKWAIVVQPKKTLLALETETVMVSPTLLRPLTTAPGTADTPGRSILKSRRALSSPSTGEKIHSVSKIHFSPYNATKVIPNRLVLKRLELKRDGDEDINIQNHNIFHDEDYDEANEDWDENYVDQLASRNAEKNSLLAEINSNELWERFD